MLVSFVALIPFTKRAERETGRDSNRRDREIVRRMSLDPHLIGMMGIIKARGPRLLFDNLNHTGGDERIHCINLGHAKSAIAQSSSPRW
jgi:hypothetical protein